MEISVHFIDYIKKLKSVQLKKFYSGKDNEFVIEDIYDFLKIINIFQDEKEKDRNALFNQ